MLTVKDTGSGMTDSVKAKIFDPFFTSRADGTGLGLAIVMQVMQEHKGSIRVRDNVHGGANFSISLPLPA